MNATAQFVVPFWVTMQHQTADSKLANMELHKHKLKGGITIDVLTNTKIVMAGEALACIKTAKRELAEVVQDAVEQPVAKASRTGAAATTEPRGRAIRGKRAGGRGGR